ncbi:MAG TPA: alpha-amylase family glycosyl hydrolase [Chthoniobacterales bacterium]
MPRAAVALLALAFALLRPSLAPGEAMLQYFNTDWNEIALKMPELAEAGYDSLWLPPPTKGSGGLSVGYDLWDRFDLGSKDQRGSVRTRYGTEADLIRMVEVAHRFGIRVYFDNVMNHNAFDVPGYDANTPIDIYPGLVPEDFHLRITQEGFYRKWDNIANWNDSWQIQHRNFSDLIDLAQEPGNINENFGLTEGSTFPKISFVRQANNPEYYCFDANGNYVGFGGLLNLAPNPLPQGFTTAHDWAVNYINTHPSAYSENVQDFLNRSVRWLVDRTKADGLRLDAVKHVRYDFFGASFGADKNTSDYGYLGQAQRQFNITRGFSDANHRDTVFDTEQPRDDLMMFGEHLGEPPDYQGYFDAGMRLVNNPLQSAMNGILGNPSSGLQGLDQPGSYGFSDSLGVMYAQSHDNDYASRRELQFALYLTRAGLGSVYTDGNHQSQTLSQSGGAFPRHANTNFLGQFGDGLIPNLLYIHNQFGRGYQVARWSDGDLVAYERMDKRENGSMSNGDGVTMLVLVNDNYANGIGINYDFNSNRGDLRTDFPPGSYLWQYASGTLPSGDSITGLYITTGDGGNGLSYLPASVVVPKGGYYVFSWRNPEQSDLWSLGGGKPITILQNNGQPVSTLTYIRKDGADGDPNFNPYGVAGAIPGSYSYPYTIPKVTNGSDLTFIARADGSAEDVLMELDGGVDINSQIPLGPTNGDKRDHPPALSTDVFLGYEQPVFVEREYPEKFAAKDCGDDTIGSVGADTYDATTSPPTDVSSNLNGNGNCTNTQSGTVASFVFHDPGAQVQGPASGTINGLPSTQFRDNGSSLDFWVKTNAVGFGFRTFVYYTTDGSNPEGAGGSGIGTTQTLEMNYSHNSSDGNNWWRATLSPKPGNPIKYKISAYKSSNGSAGNSTPISSTFPANDAAVQQKKKMLTTFKIPHFNATTALVYPHNDYGATQTGLTEGFHVLRARAFLKRDNQASIYNTFVQPFYYDAQAPQGEIKFPAENDTIGGSRYGVVVRTDASVTEVWYHIDDGDNSNDDINTKTQGGNGVGFEPFTDTNANGTRDASESFTDLNGNGIWDNNIATTWVKATELTANPAVSSVYPKEWRFDYANIPASGNPVIKVRLRELSSAEYKDFNLTDAQEHYTTLVRNVTAAGPNTKMFVAFPSNDGDLVDSNYIMKVWFSKSLANGIDDQTLINRLLIKIASSESGSPANGVPQSRSGYTINRDVTNDYHELRYTLPNVYNDNPDFLHTIDVTYTNPGDPALEAFRLVKARPIPVIRDVILTPPEVDSDGKAYVIVLPDVAAPTAAQRAIPIQVETDLNATNVAVNFTIGSGNITLNPGTSGTPNPTTSGSSKFWNLTWNNASEGSYQFLSTVTAPTGTATAYRNALVDFRQIVVNGEPFSDTNGNGVHDAGEPFTDSNGNGVYDPPKTGDIDDDGLGLYTPTAGTPAPIETTAFPLPSTNSETWTNDQVHISAISGKTDPLNPDSDSDGLSDGLELGWGSAVGDTNVNTDTNGDGIPNFQPDLDPPIYNTTDNASAPAGYEYFNPWPYNLNNSRTDQIAGSVTDPNKPDTDDDGLNDGIEDLRYLATTVNNQTVLKPQHFGRVDIGLVDGNGNITSVIKHPPTIYNTSKVDRTKLPANAIFLTSDPNNPDTDGDGIPDGTEDANHNGYVDLAIIDRAPGGTVTVLGPLDDSNALGYGKFHDFCYTFNDTSVSPNKAYVYNRISKTKLAAQFPRPNVNQAGHTIDVIWLETDPLNTDTDADGLPDGWERSHNLDPLDDGVAGHYAMGSGLAANPDNGANGNPDNDTFINNGQTQPYTNIQEFLNNTDPRVADTGIPPPPGAITIGTGTTTTVGAVTNKHEFTDWTADDLIALDAYDGDGGNFNQGDVYHANDGFDTSRDLVAFYTHDGGSDGNLYFRVDMHDLKAFAEQGNLDIYVVINFGNPGTGEFNLPDQIDTGTALKWQAVVACYSSDNGRIYLWDKTVGASHSTAIGQDLSAFHVTVRDQNTANGFKKAYFNSDLDSVEFSISRQALIDAGWNGIASNLLYQVFTTRDGTQNSPVGAGDIGGRSDIRDSIRDNGIASDYWQDQPNIAGANSVLHQFVGINADNDRGKRVKIMSVVHGNQAIQAGNVIQNLINNGAGAGYYRVLDAHEAFGVPLTLHVTPTLASAIQWARVAVGSPNTFHDGPALNARIGNLIGAGTIDLLGSTFSDHVLDYFNSPFNIDNVSLANNFLANIYGHAPSTAVFWTPERVSDSGVLQKTNDAGFQYTFVDQMRHIFKWFGRNSALGNDGYRINQINNTKAFVISDAVSNQLFVNDDNGLPVLLRQLLSRKARDGQQDQVVTFINQWEDFGTKANADAYDKNIRWLANHPWIQVVTPDQIASNQVAFNSNGGTATQWGTVGRGTGLSLPNVSKDFIDHADEESYDNWYNGSALEESLSAKKFSIRTGVSLPNDATHAYGLLGTSGIVNSAWSSVSGIVPTAATNGLFSLARATLHASTFETAFHNQTNNDLSKFSTGAYINPDTVNQTLSGFSKIAQAQTRKASIYARVNTWAQNANAGNYNTSAVAEQTDVDLDGENEYLIYNDRIFALFERIGGRMTHAWLRDYDTGYVSQVVGNSVSYAGSETEEEGGGNFNNGAVVAYRTSGFKDWFAKTDANGTGTFGYVNDLYNVVAAPSGIGWKFTSSDGKISKTITLTPGKNALQASYTTTGFVQLYIRFGLSPDLLDLLMNGQTNLGNLLTSTQEINLFDNNNGRSVRAYLRFGGTGFSGASLNATANDSDAVALDTVAMRNQAQTQQVEIQGNGSMNFALGFETGAAQTYDSDADGIPDWWTQQYFGHAGGQAGDLSRPGDDPDGDGRTNAQEYMFGSNPKVSDVAASELIITRTSSTANTLTFPTIHNRLYQLYYSSSPSGTWMPAGGATFGTGSTGNYLDNGTDTGSPPTSIRFYKLQVSLVP